MAAGPPAIGRSATRDGQLPARDGRLADRDDRFPARGGRFAARDGRSATRDGRFGLPGCGRFPPAPATGPQLPRGGRFPTAVRRRFPTRAAADSRCFPTPRG
ncbi:hypothetical protein GCM10010470_53150 [Saccharopolyspora taberi]|uniref:Uncharacterized protein n=1 Tax=Saccharopolyspora taberi TaxID=60895 RepID=A0ABN3VKX9_9PSEU